MIFLTFETSVQVTSFQIHTFWYFIYLIFEFITLNLKQINKKIYLKVSKRVSIWNGHEINRLNKRQQQDWGRANSTRKIWVWAEEHHLRCFICSPQWTWALNNSHSHHVIDRILPYTNFPFSPLSMSIIFLSNNRFRSIMFGTHMISLMLLKPF